MLVDTEKLKVTLQRELDVLRQTRDELKLQISLAKAEVKSEWDRLEGRLSLAQEEINRLGSHSKLAVHELEETSRKLLEDLKRGYERIRHGH